MGAYRTPGSIALPGAGHGLVVDAMLGGMVVKNRHGLALSFFVPTLLPSQVKLALRIVPLSIIKCPFSLPNGPT